MCGLASGAQHFYSFEQRFDWLDNEVYQRLGPRSDPVWPLSVWRGGDPVDWALARRPFEGV